MNNNKGFTLVEIIVVITIMAILAAISFPGLYSYISDSTNSRYQTDTLSLYSSAKNEESKYLISGGYDEPAQLYADNPTIGQYITTKLNEDFATLGISLNLMEYYQSATQSDDWDIPANTYLFNFTTNDNQISALVTDGDQIKIVAGNVTVPTPSYNTDTKTNNGNNNSTTITEPETPTTPEPGQSNDEADTPPASATTSIDSAKFLDLLQTINADATKDEKDKAFKLIDNLQSAAQSQGGYPELTASELALIDGGSGAVWVPFISEDVTSVFFVASYNPGDIESVSSSLIYIDGSYYRYYSVDATSNGDLYRVDTDGRIYDDLTALDTVGQKSYISGNKGYWQKII